MKVFQTEFDIAKKYSDDQLRDFPGFTAEQLEAIRLQSGRYYRWYKAHPWLHNGLSVLVLALLLGADYCALLRLPTLLSDGLGPDSTFRIKLITSLACGLAHGFIGYSLAVYTIHEGGAHNGIIQVSGKLTRAMKFLANNASRLVMADPIFYKAHHTAHHGKFATAYDGSFTNFVFPRRFYRSFLPYAAFLDYNDFRVHAGTRPSLSRGISMLVGSFYIGVYSFFLVPRFGWTFMILTTLVINIHFAFLLDRLREGIEHNLMPVDRHNGTRNFGYGFWGMLIGGGPWGQGCHLSHHLAPTLPWYHQLMLHRKLTKLLSSEQKKVFFVQPGIGFPLLVARIFKESWSL